MRTPWHRINLGAMTILAILVWAPLTRAATPPMRVAVRHFKAKGVDASVASTLETAFCTDLSQHAMDVLCPDDLSALLAEKQEQIGLGGCDDAACLKNIANMSHASRLVAGEVSKLGSEYIVSVTMIDIATGRIMARASDKAGKPEDLIDKLTDLANKLAQAK